MLLVGRLLHLGLGNAHGAEVLLGSAHEEDEHDGEQRIEVVRDGLDERCETAFAQVAAYGHGPRRHRRDDADRRRGGVDDPCQLLVADVESIGDGAHDRAHREAVEVVVHEDDDAQHRSENLRHLRVLDVRRHPLGVRARSAGGRDDHHERAQ